MNRRALALVPFAVAASCIKPGYPLSSSGNVDVRIDVSNAQGAGGPLFAANAVDATGNAVGPRQIPYQTGVTLFMTEDGDPAYGGTVRVSVTPQEALTIASDPSEGDSPSCTITDGAFQCMATSEGFARFVLTSPGDWSGQAELNIAWAAPEPKQVPIQVYPAGLPPSVNQQNFQLVVSDLATDGHVTADYSQLVCSVSPTPAKPQSEWKHIRIHEAHVRATPPPDLPLSLENAPITVAALSADVRISKKKDCSALEPSISTTLDANGNSPSFYLCFSDAGGSLLLTYTSGTTSAMSTFTVDSEPHLLKVEPINPQAPLSVAAGDVPAFDVAAYGADLEQRIALPVHMSLAGTAMAKLDRAAFTLTGDVNQPPDEVTLLPISTGGLVLHVTPGVFSKPDCASVAIHVDP